MSALPIVDRDRRPGVEVAGYSGTPLVRKLGVKQGHRVAFPGAPDSFADDLGALPPDVQVKRIARAPLDLVVSFCHDRARLAATFDRHRDALEPDGALWIAWPKKASGVPTDLDGNVVRSLGLEHGLVDVKVCAIDDTWSGLKFVRRVADR